MLQVISYETVRKFAEALSGTCELLVCDEGHRLAWPNLRESVTACLVYAYPSCWASSDELRPPAG